jgi:hypothetical protein
MKANDVFAVLFVPVAGSILCVLLIRELQPEMLFNAGHMFQRVLLPAVGMFLLERYFLINTGDSLGSALVKMGWPDHAYE